MTNENGRSSTPPPGEEEPALKYPRLDYMNVYRRPSSTNAPANTHIAAMPTSGCGVKAF